MCHNFSLKDTDWTANGPIAELGGANCLSQVKFKFYQMLKPSNPRKQRSSQITKGCIVFIRAGHSVQTESKVLRKFGS